MTVEWHKVAELDELPEGRVMTVTVGRRSLALTHFQGAFGCLDNRRPHQGGPLGEGSIEKGWLRCPWHGYDYHPLDGQPPEGFDDAAGCFPTEVRADGIHVAIPPEPPRDRTVSDVMVETMVDWGVDTVFGMVGHSNLGLAEAMRVAEERGDLRYYGIRHEGAASFAATAYGKLTGRLAACFGIAGPGSTNLLTGLELTTAVKYGMNITHILLNNDELAKISREQRAARYEVWQTGLHNPDFAAFAELCGAKGIRVTESDRLEEEVGAALAHPGPALVRVLTDPLLV